MKIDERDLEIVKGILNEFIPNVEVRAFGSRVKGTNRAFSDLDIALLDSQKVDLKIISLLKEAFDESDLPFRVDVVDYMRVQASFRKIIDYDFELLQDRS